MKIKYDSIRVTLFTIFGIALMFIVYSALNRLSVTKHDSYNIKALFSDLKQLQIGDDVRVAGVRVGSVTNTSLNRNLAVATLSVEKRFSIPEDSVATILMSGLLGANYVSIIPGTSQKNITDNSYIDTQKAVDISSVVRKFSSIGDRLDRVLSSFDGSGDDIATEGKPTLFQDIADFVRNNKDKMSQVIDDCSVITHKIAQGEGTLGRIIHEDKAYNDLIEMMDSIKVAAQKVDGMIKSFQGVADDIRQGNGLLGKLMYDPKVEQSFSKIIKNIENFSGKLNNDNSTLGRIITSDSLYKQAESAIGKVEKAVDSVANSGPITAVGAAANALF